MGLFSRKAKERIERDMKNKCLHEWEELGFSNGVDISMQLGHIWQLHGIQAYAMSKGMVLEGDKNLNPPKNSGDRDAIDSMIHLIAMRADLDGEKYLSQLDYDTYLRAFRIELDHVTLYNRLQKNIDQQFIVKTHYKNLHKNDLDYVSGDSRTRFVYYINPKLQLFLQDHIDKGGYKKDNAVTTPSNAVPFNLYMTAIINILKLLPRTDKDKIIDILSI